VNQDVQETLFCEVDRVLEGRQGADVTADDLNEMKYLKMVLKETLRLHNIVTSQTRVIDNDMEIGGYFIPKGVSDYKVTSTLNAAMNLCNKLNTFLY